MVNFVFKRLQCEVSSAAWQMTRSPDDAKGRRNWEESSAWRCDEWREAHVKLMNDDPRNNTRSGRVLSQGVPAGNDHSRDFLRLVALGQSGAP